MVYRTESGSDQLMSFNNFLSVKTGLIQNESPTELPVSVKFIVSNLALCEPRYAEVLFDEVLLRYGIPPNWNVEKYNNLSAGQSFTVDYKCRYEDLPEIKYEVEGKVSYDTFFKAKTAVGKLNPIQTALNTIALLQAFNDTKIHHWLEGTIKNIPVPDDRFSLAELRVEVEVLRVATKEIEDMGKYLEDFTKYAHIESPDVQKYHTFKDSLQKYLRETIVGLGQLRNALEAPNSTEFQKFAPIRDNIILRLSKFGSELNKLTEEFMQAKNVSDVDAHYLYRNWQK